MADESPLNFITRITLDAHNEVGTNPDREHVAKIASSLMSVAAELWIKNASVEPNGPGTVPLDRTSYIWLAEAAFDNALVDIHGPPN